MHLSPPGTVFVFVTATIRKALNRFGYSVFRSSDTPVEAVFHSPNYLRHTARRLEHLASLRIPVAAQTVLEVGAGAGDHSHYYMDRNCSVTITDARSGNLSYIRARYPDARVEFLDMEDPHDFPNGPFDIVHCYGVLYHLSRPAEALAFLSRQCKRALFLESAGSFGGGMEIHPVKEGADFACESATGMGCRPTRPWIFAELKKHFEYVYVPKTQPNHDEFPVDWTALGRYGRAVFVASREPINNEILSTELLLKQRRHE